MAITGTRMQLKFDYYLSPNNTGSWSTTVAPEDSSDIVDIVVLDSFNSIIGHLCDQHNTEWGTW
jgi:hypothetical protein